VSKLAQKLAQLKKEIKIPYKVEYVDQYIPEEQWEDKVIYIHFWLKEEDNELGKQMD